MQIMQQLLFIVLEVHFMYEWLRTLCFFKEIRNNSLGCNNLLEKQEISSFLISFEY